MAVRRRTDPHAGRAAFAAWQAGAADQRAVTMAVRFTLEEIADIAPGHAVEVRVPPWGAVQCLEGPTHTRGTPPNVVETDPDTWLGLVAGAIAWGDAVHDGRISASGERSDISDLLPLQALRVRN